MDKSQTEIRSYFPSLLNLPERVYFNNESNTQLPNTVMTRIHTYLTRMNINPDHDRLNTMENKYGTQKVISFINSFVQNTKCHLMFGNTVHELITFVMGSMMCPNDRVNIIVSDYLCSDMYNDDEAEIKIWYSNNFKAEYKDLFDLIDEDTKLIILPHVSNINGCLFDIVYIVQEVKKINNNVKICVDGRDYVRHRSLNVDALDVDFYVFSFEKCFSINVSVLLYDKSNGCEGNTQMVVPYVNVYAIWGFVDYIQAMTKKTSCDSNYHHICTLFFDQIYKIEETLKSYFLVKLEKYKNICHLITDCTKDSVCIFALNFKRFHNDYVMLLLSECNIICTNDIHRNDMLLVDTYDNFIRVALCHYNTTCEIDYFMSILNELQKLYFTRSNSFMESFLGFFEQWKYTTKTVMLTIEFQQSFHNLVKDNYSQNNQLSRFSLVYTKLKTIVGNGRKMNCKVYSSNLDYVDSLFYEHVNIMKLPNASTIIDIFCNTIYSKCLISLDYVEIEQIRMLVDTLTYEFDTKEIENDSTYVGLLCVRRKNILNRSNNIQITKNDENNKIIYEENFPIGQMIILDSRNTRIHLIFEKHDNNNIAYIDLLILRSIF